jgi:hypothetical protein
VDDADESPAFTLTLVGPGAQGNGATLEILAAGDANDALAIACTMTGDVPAFVVTPATDAGDAATTTIGSGTNGTVTITAATAGPAGNSITRRVVVAATEDAAMSVQLDNNVLTVTLGTDSNGDAAAAKNTATLIAAAIHALPALNATASGTGASSITTAASSAAFTGGGANAAITTTAAELVAEFNRAFPQLVTATLADAYDGSGLIEELAEDSFTGGSNGVFADFDAGETGDFTAAGEREFSHPGEIKGLNILVSSAGGSTDIDLFVTKLRA